MEKKTNKIIAIDFDGTLCEDEYPKIGRGRSIVIGALKSQQAAGARVILWTCRTGERLQEALKWCKTRNIKFDAVNDNLPDIKSEYGDNARKIFADEYWDDRNKDVKIDLQGLYFKE